MSDMADGYIRVIDLLDRTLGLFPVKSGVIYLPGKGVLTPVSGNIPFSYIIFIDSSGKVCAKNSKTGAIDYIDSDAYTVIMAAINAVDAGSTIFISSGVYYLTNTLTSSKKVLLMGEGEGTKLLPTSSFNAVDTTNIKLLNLVWRDSAGVDNNETFYTQLFKSHRTAVPIDHPDASIPISKLAFGTLRKVAEVYVSTSLSQITIPDLDIVNDKFYLLFSFLKNATGSTLNYHLLYNFLTTTTNYYNQSLIADGSTVTAARSNDPSFASAPANGVALTLCYIVLDADGYPRCGAFTIRAGASTPLLELRTQTYINTLSNITRLVIKPSTSADFGVGSRVMIFAPSV
jgi:hypothetical protein